MLHRTAPQELAQWPLDVGWRLGPDEEQLPPADRNETFVESPEAAA